MDNANKNGKCLEALQHSFSSIDPEADRIRCIGHIVNLVVKALLFGKGVSAWEKNVIEASEEQHVALWSLKGVISKLHNLVIHINRIDARRELLRARMRITKTSDSKLFVGVLLNGGGIRWNATYYMIERAVKYKNEKHKNDFLTEADWYELELFYKLLQPFKRLTKRLQSRADSESNEGGQGSVWQVLYAMDFLPTKLENIKKEIDVMDADNEVALPSYYSAGVLAIKTAEKELTVYYDLFAAVTVTTEHVDQAVASPSSSPTINIEFDAWGHTTDRPRRGKRRKVETEWEIWIKQVPSKDHMTVKNPLAWWVDRRHVWPILSKLALNIFSTPAMSAEPERVFSDGIELITDKRNGLSDDTVEAEMIQKN
ncbi:transposase-like protein [Fusarium austroafricanum]|uniref:Transposase-like protein n=1 Tax=Fusarium austroafricanum TaxID=2364996 RepID=A0A8H4KCC3_9HYPO|nr:transposase-like protein [Fusarium austroafricanum]